MTGNLKSPIRLTKDQVKPAAEMMARAFQDYPLSAFFHPDPFERMRRGVQVYIPLLRYGIQSGEVYATSSNLEGVAVWLPHDRVQRTLWRNIRSGNFSVLFRRGGNSRPQAFHEYSTAVRKRRAPVPHLYLQLLGVDPAHQGRGYSSLLLRAMFIKIDKEGLPCFLETQAEKNVGIYEHLGFRVVEEGIVPGSNVKSWAMLRDKAE
jgi:GNAT superfamily N-acetyltransferase